MATMKEVSRRSMFFEDEGMACGPVGITAIDAEIVVEEEGEKTYLHAQWVSEAGEEILYEARKASAYDYYEKMNQSGEIEVMEELMGELEKIEVIMDDARYEPIYTELKEMVIEEMKAHDLDPDYFFGEDEDEDDDEEE